MVLRSPGDVLININGFSVYYYGVIMAVACIVGVYTAYKLYKKYNPNSNYNRIWDFAAYLLICGILGARLYYCILNPIKYINNPIEIINIREGGLSIHGALIAGILALICLSKKYKLDYRKLLDVFACGTSLAQCIGRWGNFFNSEAFGIPTNLPWKLYIPVSERPLEYINYDYFHPTFLYESISDLIIFIILLLILKRNSNNYPGTIFCCYLILYSLVRLFIEEIRTDSVLIFAGLHIAQIVSILFIFLGIIGLVFYKKIFIYRG